MSRINCEESRRILSCPFFLPTERADNIAFPHPARLPLGASWRGSCTASGHEKVQLDQKELEYCNLGYAKSCPRLPKERACDAVRFSIAKDLDGRIALQFVFEAAYLPGASGFLEFDQRSNTWISSHPDPVAQKKAECFLHSYLERRNRQ